MSEKASIKKDVQLEFTLSETPQLLRQFGVHAVVFDGSGAQVTKNLVPGDVFFDSAVHRDMLDGGFYGYYMGIQLLGRKILENSPAVPGNK